MEVIIVFWLAFSVVVGIYANGKGLSGGLFFVLALLLSPLLAFIIAAISKPDEARLVASGAHRKCPFCAELIKPDAKVCRFCGRDLPDGQP